MKYLLFVYPYDDNWDPTESNEKIALDLAMISKSDDIKYVYGESHSIFHFDTKMSPSEMNIYVEHIKCESPDFMFVLVQGINSVSSNMDNDHLEHLLELKHKSKKSKPNPIDGFLSKNQDNSVDVINELTNKAIDILKNQSCDLTIDEILDKITNQGINSLTIGEKNRLDEYSKQI